MSNVGVEGENSVGRTLEPVRKSGLGISTDIRAEMAEIVGNIVPAATSVAKSDTVSAIAIGREATSEASKNIAAKSSRVSKRTAALLQNTVSSGLRASADIRAEMADIVASIIPAATKVVKTDAASAVSIGREATSEASKNIAATSVRFSTNAANLLENSLNTMSQLTPSLSSGTMSSFLRTIPQQVIVIYISVHRSLY